MKAIIDGKRYDTETATCIADYTNVGSTASSMSDFRAFLEKLYRTKKGSWFLAGGGGAMSKYSQPVSGGSGGGSRIIPLTEDEAFEWLQDTGQTELLEEYFAERIEDA